MRAGCADRDEEDAGTFLEAATQLGAKLCDEAIWNGDTCGWSGPLPTVVDGSWTSTVRPFGPELYSGTSGVALALARLYRATGEERFAATAAAGVRDALARLGEIPPLLRCSFYTGFAGIAAAALELGEALEDDRWIQTGLRLLTGLGQIDPEVQAADVLSGIAGTIPVLLDVHRRYRSTESLEAAVRFGSFLVADANRSDDAWSWSSRGTATPPGDRDLAGLAHGAAGIARALLELHRVTDDESFRAAADGGFRYEQRWFSSARENWADVRAVDPDGNAGAGAYLVQWCYGAAGIGLAHLRAYELLGDVGHRLAAEAALRTVTRDLRAFPDNLQPNYSLCHGVCGNADLLLGAAAVFGDAEPARLAAQIGREGVARHLRRSDPWPSGAADGRETPGLMWGIAGTAHFYLRLHDPAETPSLLLPVPG
ncbi:MAG TPA: lanthionine synthetase LanC family protein [Gaiellaceae bacterium]|jgi:lantibiotic modifying enzyme|nr:lanthionine synthetase LanC family protein [Gaiellaceae bacterium]